METKVGVMPMTHRICFTLLQSLPREQALSMVKRLQELNEKERRAANTVKNQLTKIVSGGQTGTDRAALDCAIQFGLEHGGWCPAGRIAEDGVIPQHYQLNELAEAGYKQRTRQNIIESDGTLILNLGELDGGTLATSRLAKHLQKPHIVLQLDSDDLEDDVASVISWLAQSQIKVLNVAGARESKRQGSYQLAREFLQQLFKVIN